MLNKFYHQDHLTSATRLRGEGNRRLPRAVAEHKFTAGETLFRNGDPSELAYLIESGNKRGATATSGRLASHFDRSANPSKLAPVGPDRPVHRYTPGSPGPPSAPPD